MWESLSMAGAVRTARAFAAFGLGRREGMVQPEAGRCNGTLGAAELDLRTVTQHSPAKHLVVFPGSFDPITYGHLDVIQRGRRLFDELVVAVGRNPGKDQLFGPDERVEMVEALVAEMILKEPAGATVKVRAFSGLTVDFAGSVGATALLRGVRNLSDLQYEVQQALTNREVAGLETAFVVAGQTFAYTSSSLIKQITAMGRDLSALNTMVPPLVVERLKRKKDEKHPLLERLAADQDVVAEG